MLSWKPPSDDGGSPITGYSVECCDSQKNLIVATKVGKDTVSLTQKNLVEGHGYMFRIIAINAKGKSEALESEDVVVPKQTKG